MARILSISYDEALLFTRELLLWEGAGHTVRSALGFLDAVRECETEGHDLLVLGHSIPKNDKVKIIGCFRKANAEGVVVALIRANEPRLAQVDAYVYPGNPGDLVRSIDALMPPPTNPVLISRAANSRGPASLRSRGYRNPTL